MDFADLLRVLFYLWLFIALGVWAVRIYRRFFASDDGDTTETAGTAAPTGKTKAAAPKQLTPSRAKRSTRLPDVVAPSTAGTDEPGDLVKAVIREEIERKKRSEAPGDTTAAAAGTDAAPTRGGLFASSDAGLSEQPSISVAEALEGIALPCDLTPTSMTGDDDDTTRAAFVTTGFSPGTVAAQVADELERLGFTIHTERDDVAVARKGSTQLRIEIYEDAATARSDGQRRFPYVANGSVAVVMST